MGDFKIGNQSFENSKVTMISGDNNGPINMGDTNHVIDVETLLSELKRLSDALEKRGFEQETQRTVKDAGDAAATGNTSLVYKRLGKAGGLILKVAKEIGVELVAGMIEKGMNM